jgi:ubiquinone/menaquinone biosynthesis C-methylase UbiE
MTEDARRLWDREAATFDEAADHGLLDARVRRAWAELLLPLIGSRGQRVVDLGCGTGTLSTLLAAEGHQVTGVDFSVEMIRRAERKATREGVTATFLVADASAPPLPAGSVDVVLSRHVLWAMPDPRAALAAWTGLLDGDGRLILIEGAWSTGAGLTANESMRLVEAIRGRGPTLRMLDDPALWGRPIEDERYLIVG